MEGGYSRRVHADGRWRETGRQAVVDEGGGSRGGADPRAHATHPPALHLPSPIDPTRSQPHIVLHFTYANFAATTTTAAKWAPSERRRRDASPERRTQNAISRYGSQTAGRARTRPRVLTAHLETTQYAFNNTNKENQDTTRLLHDKYKIALFTQSELLMCLSTPTETH